LILNIIKRIDDIYDEYNTAGDPDSERLVNLFDDIQALAEGGRYHKRRLFGAGSYGTPGKDRYDGKGYGDTGYNAFFRYLKV
jgi:hypothetical protein